jgi:hypothetical protein
MRNSPPSDGMGTEQTTTPQVIAMEPKKPEKEIIRLKEFLPFEVFEKIFEKMMENEERLMEEETESPWLFPKSE